MPDREGQRLGNYRLVRLLGKGSFAEVYLGEHLYLNNYAAIKVLLASLTEKDEQVFLSEAKTLAQLAHPNIVRVHDFAIERDLPFLVMDYAPGGTLRQRYPKGMCLSLDHAVTAIKQVATALQYAHNHGIIHRDVKPENVLQGSQEVMLSDFGISLHLPSVSASNSQGWAGTLPYIAPEQLQGKAVYASDQYSLAIMAYEWLCGVRPFEGNAMSLAYQHAQTPPPPLREKDPSLPAAVEKVILKALSKDPRDRYTSVITFARVLERVSQEGVHDRIDVRQTERLGDPQQRSTPRRIFLSHATTNNVSRLKTDLETRDIIVTDLAAATIPQPDNAGTPDNAGARLISPVPAHNEEAARQAIRAAQLVLLVVSPQTRSSLEVKEHLRITGIYRRPALCVWAAGEKIDDLLPVGAQQAPVIDSRGSRYGQALDDIMAHLERERRGIPIAEHIASEPVFEPRNPYKGLHAFTQQDRHDFFGRETLVKEMVSLLRDTLLPAAPGSPAKRLLTIVGPSGSGKSSVAMAGLLPQLQEGAIEGSKSWIYLDPLVPGRQPIDALAAILATRFPDKGVQAVREVLGREGGLGLHQLALATAHQDTRVVLLIDQFEDLFSPDVSESERQHFINLLVTAVTEPQGPLLLILTLRADLYDRPLAYPSLGRLIQQSQCTVLPMETEDIRSVIERPALQPDVRLIFEEDLIGDLLYEIRGQPAALPLLEFTLDQLFSHRRGHRLTRHAYQEMGGVRGALSKHAEDTYARLPSEEHRRLTRSVFMRLIQPAATGHDPIRRRADLSEFSLENEQQTRILREIIQAFLTARLLTINQISGVTTLEVSHEALLREWPRLSEWTREASADIRLQQTISKAVAEWEQRGMPKDRLYRGTQLKESLAWLERNIASSSEMVFLRASTARSKRERISLFVVACLILALLIPAGLLAQQQFSPPTVTTFQDGGPGSLRQLIETVQPGSTIYFAPNIRGHLSLTHALEIPKSLNFRGPGANLLSIGGTTPDIMLIKVDAKVNATFSDLTFSEPKTSIGSSFFTDGSLTLDHCIIANNTETGQKLVNSPNQNTAFAAAIYNTGTLTFQNSLITNNTINTGTGGGGGILNDKGTVILTNSQITTNTLKSTGQGGVGGALYSRGGKVILNNSTISSNKLVGGAQGGIGGGIFSDHDTLSLTGSTVSNNSVSDNTDIAAGGGIAGNGSTITLTSSHVTGNTVVAHSSANGGGIFSLNGSVTLMSSVVSQNSARGDTQTTSGGGLSGLSSIITITNSQISNNTLTSNVRVTGGGVDGQENSSITITSSSITNNTITAPTVHGAGVSSLNGKVTISDTTVSNNTAKGAQGVNEGGGIFDADTLTITNSIISHNTLTSTYPAAGGSTGGGISVSGTLNLTNSTVSDNTINDTNGISNGAGILVIPSVNLTHLGGTVKLTNSTISNNTASGSKGSYGGGIELEGVSGTIDFCTIYGNTAATKGGGLVSGLLPLLKADTTLKNTLIANNSSANGPDLMGTVTTGGYNLVQRFSGATWNDPANKHATDLSGDKFLNLGIDPQLRASGKATPTHALLPTSPALNQIPSASCDVPVDQRGVKRPQQSACDIGAYEYTP